MDSSFSPKDETWFLRVCHHISDAVCMSHGFCCLLAGGILIPLASSQQNLYDIYLLLFVQCWTPDDGQRNCPKHVDFYSKNKFEKLVHIFGFSIRKFVVLVFLYPSQVHNCTVEKHVRIF